MIRTGLLAVGVLLAARPAVAQDPDFRSRIDPETAAAVMPVLEAAAMDSLPMDALESKVLEGIAKRVPPDRIVQAVTELTAEFRSMRAALSERLTSVTVTDAEIVAAARAVRQGVTVDALGNLWDARPPGTGLEVPVTVLGELVRRGIPVEEASGLMSHVLRTDVPLHLAAQIPGKFDGALGATASTPVAALTEALRVLDIPNPPGRRPGG